MLWVGSMHSYRYWLSTLSLFCAGCAAGPHGNPPSTSRASVPPSASNSGASTVAVDSSIEPLVPGLAPSAVGISPSPPPELSPGHSSSNFLDSPVGGDEEPTVERSPQRGFGPEEGDSSSFGMVNLSNPKSSVGNSKRSLKVRFGAPETQGGLDGNVVQRILRQGIGAFRNCYENVLLQSSKTEGRLTLAFEINERGSVSQPTVVESDFKDPVMTPCVVSVISSLAFPKPDRLPAKVTLPVLFSR
jgi:hypothetical protein